MAFNLSVEKLSESDNRITVVVNAVKDSGGAFPTAVATTTTRIIQVSDLEDAQNGDAPVAVKLEKFIGSCQVHDFRIQPRVVDSEANVYFMPGVGGSVVNGDYASVGYLRSDDLDDDANGDLHLIWPLNSAPVGSQIGHLSAVMSFVKVYD